MSEKAYGLAFLESWTKTTFDLLVTTILLRLSHTPLIPRPSRTLRSFPRKRKSRATTATSVFWPWTPAGACTRAGEAGPGCGGERRENYAHARHTLGVMAGL